MPPQFTVTNTAGSLGDWISLTPLLRAARDAGRDSLVIALDSPHTRAFATLYEGLASVQFCKPGETVADTPETGHQDRCFAERILLAHGLDGVSPIPFVEVTDDEFDAAYNLLEATLPDGARPVAFSHTVGGARPDMPDTHMGAYRRLPVGLRDRLIGELRAKGLQPVRFGTRSQQSHVYANHEEIEGVLTIPDLTLRQLAACYAVIGRYTGTDTGDRHLALAAGATCDTWVPPDAWFYRHGRHHYGETAWAHELAAGRPVRETYHTFPRDLPTAS